MWSSRVAINLLPSPSCDRVLTWFFLSPVYVHHLCFDGYAMNTRRPLSRIRIGLMNASSLAHQPLGRIDGPRTTGARSPVYNETHK